MATPRAARWSDDSRINAGGGANPGSPRYASIVACTPPAGRRDPVCPHTCAAHGGSSPGTRIRASGYRPRCSDPRRTFSHSKRSATYIRILDHEDAPAAVRDGQRRVIVAQ